MNLKKKLKVLKCLKIKPTKPLKLFFNIIRLQFCTYFKFYINCNKHAILFYYPLDDYNIFDII